MVNKVSFDSAIVRTTRALLVVAFALISIACASVVYKDSATTFVAVGRVAGKQMDDSSKQLDSAEDAIRSTEIATDASCPIGDKRLFVRAGKVAPATLVAALDRFPNQAALSGCKKLLSCEQPVSANAGRVPMDCRSACYSSEEGNCLSQLERSYAIELKATPANGSALEEGTSFATFLQRTEYRRAGSVESKLVGSGVRDLSEYLDVLAKVAEARKSEYPDDAKRLSERLSSLVKGVGEASGKQLSNSSQATQKQVQTALGALGELAGVLQTMSQDAQDASKIKQLVTQNQVNVEGLIATLRAVALGDGTLAATYSDLSMRRARAMLQARFAKTSDPYSRSLLLVERENYLYTDGDTMLKAVNDVFDSLSKSHLALVSLVNNPTDEQKKTIINERLQNFKAVVSAFVDVAQAVK